MDMLHDMRITGIQLTNWKCFEEAQLDEPCATNNPPSCWDFGV